MDAAKKAKIRRKIEALLATARHPNTDDQVAQTYLAKAAELSTLYNIHDQNERATPNPSAADPGVCWWDTHVIDTGGRGAACAAGLAYVIDACGGMSVRDKARSTGGYRVTVVATEAAMTLIKALVPVVVEQMHQRSVAACKQWRAEQLGGVEAATAHKWREDYVRAFGFGLAERIRAGNRQIVEEDTSAGVMLDRDRERVQRAYQRRFGLRVRTAPAQGVSHDQAIAAGRRDGRATTVRTEPA